MFRSLVLFIILFLVCPLFAAVDSAQIAAGISTASQIAALVAAASGHANMVSLITQIAAGLFALLGPLWVLLGHKLGKSTAPTVIHNYAAPVLPVTTTSAPVVQLPPNSTVQPQSSVS
jgi:hypothetical protein